MGCAGEQGSCALHSTLILLLSPSQHSVQEEGAVQEEEEAVQEEEVAVLQCMAPCDDYRRWCRRSAVPPLAAAHCTGCVLEMAVWQYRSTRASVLHCLLHSAPHRYTVLCSTATLLNTTNTVLCYTATLLHTTNTVLCYTATLLNTTNTVPCYTAT